MLRKGSFCFVYCQGKISKLFLNFFFFFILNFNCISMKILNVYTSSASLICSVSWGLCLLIARRKKNMNVSNEHVMSELNCNKVVWCVFLKREFYVCIHFEIGDWILVYIAFFGSNQYNSADFNSLTRVNGMETWNWIKKVCNVSPLFSNGTEQDENLK